MTPGGRRFGVVAVVVAVLSGPARGDEKLIVRDEISRDVTRFTVAEDGGKLYFAGQKYFVFDAAGKLIDQIGVPEGCAPRDLIPLPDGWFIACSSYVGGHVALCRPDGTEARTLVRKGGNEKTLRNDTTGWTTPVGAAVDARRKLIFVLDTTVGAPGVPDPEWSRVAVFDFDGKYIRDINRYDARAKADDDAKRTWYDDLALDTRRQRVYLLARRTRALLAFDYEGKALGRVAAHGEGGIAVFPDGRVAVGAGQTIQIFDPELRPVRTLSVARSLGQSSIGNMETDGAGRLYASTTDPAVTFLRWPPDLSGPVAFGPRYLRLEVEFPGAPVKAGQSFPLKVQVAGRPEPERPGVWQVMYRPSDGSDLRWRSLAVASLRGELRVALPSKARGLYDVAVRYGSGPIDRADWQRDPYLVKTLAVAPSGASRSLAILTDSGRRAFRQGEFIRVQLVRLATGDAPARVRVDLKGADGAVLATVTTPVRRALAGLVPAGLTRRLPPGRYFLAPTADGHESYALPIDIAPSVPDSPLQRILYHEMTPGAASRQYELADTAERLAFIRAATRGVAGLGFTRETDRRLEKIDKKNGPVGWRRDQGPAAIDAPGLPPMEYLAVPTIHSDWETEFYLDRAVRFGIRYDSQLLGHCSGVRFRESWLSVLVPVLQRGVQWFSRYPSFVGVNYNDELFFGGFAVDWNQEDIDWLNAVERGKLRGKPHADTLDYAVRVMYDRFNAAVHQADPEARITTTPMWQFPAEEGSYAPSLYRGMDETYTHFLSESYALPWYPAHSVEFLRRPGLLLMGVFDNGYKGEGGDVYLKNLMQVTARGVQGVGVEHLLPFEDPRGADAYRTANLLARLYGPIFAEAPPLNAGAILYSRTQDITEKRNRMGTPHWERVYSLLGAGLMAGVPLGIAYEEDIASGWLLNGKGPRVPWLFLVGQKQPLPAEVARKIARFQEAGGTVFTDADSAGFPRATRLALHTHEIRATLHEGFASDSNYALTQPIFEALAKELTASVAAKRPFPIDTDDLWVSKNLFDGGAIRYMMLASETSPYPWDSGAVWSLGTVYNKTYLPKTVTLTFPSGPGVVYDVFDRTLVKPSVSGRSARLAADLTTFPGRLYALAPAKLGAPRVVAGLRGDTLSYRVEIVDESGKRLSARVPLRIRLTHDATVARDIVRGTDSQGTYLASLTLPATAREWTLEVTELLGGAGSAVAVAHDAALGSPLAQRPEVEGERQGQIRDLLRDSHGTVTLVTETPHVLSQARQTALAAALKKQGITLKIAPTPPKEVAPGVLLTAGFVNGQYGQGGHSDDDPLWQAWKRGLLPVAVSEHVPGPGRGLISAVFAPRGDREHAIVLLGGDAEGLDRTVTRFIAWLDPRPAEPDTAPSAPAVYSLTARPAEVGPIPRLRDRVGVKLSEVKVADDGKHLVISALGYHRNLALIEDQGTQARIVRAERVGQAPTSASVAVAPDGSWFGASGREVSRIGQAFHLFDARGKGEHFAAFGDIGRQTYRFAASERGDVVLAPGTNGVVCWKRGAQGWKETWAADYWKEFLKLDWPVSATAERLPQFHAWIPRGADYALVLFGETTNNWWITPDNPSAATLSAVRLSDGKPLWRFAVPIPKTLLFPTLHASPDGSKMVLQVQKGSWKKETYQFFTVADGKALASWDSKTEPLAVAVADGTGWVASVSSGRLLELRRPDGTLLLSRVWPDQPVSLAFTADGHGLYVADDAGRLTRLDPEGNEVWRLDLGTVAGLAARQGVVYAAGWDGRLRSYGEDGKARWTLDCTPSLRAADPWPMVVATVQVEPRALHRAERPPTTVATVPNGENLLRNGRATLTLGGTSGWMSDGTVQVKPEDLTNGKADDVTTPWLSVDELFWDANAGRQVWAEITLKAPTDVRALTVRENPRTPNSWPTAAVVQVWNEALKKWETAARGDFLTGDTNTYPLNLKAVTRLRYVPWESYYRNFYTSEIELR